MTRLAASALAVLAALGVLLAVSPVNPSAEAAGTVIRVGTDPIAHPVPSGIVGANHRWPDHGLGMWDAVDAQPAQRIVDLARQTNVRLIRYPGGTVANLFQWKRAVGPQADRGCQVGGGFVGSAQPFDSVYGPDENQRFVAEIGAGTTIMANATTQSVQDAADFVEYMNAHVGTNPGGGTDWARVRAANGHPEPYAIDVWELGNELYLDNQFYWRSEDLDQRLRQYAFGGRQRQVDQPVGTPCDNRETAATSNGEPGQRFQVWYPPVAPRSQVVRIGGILWRPIADLDRADPDSPVYAFDPASGAIAFGDGTHGRIPPAGAEIRADYVSGPHPGFVDYYAAMKRVDPSIDICSTWERAEFVKLMGTRHPYDCIGPHLYARPDVSGEPAQIHDRQMPLVDDVLDELSQLEAAIDTYAPASRRPYLEVSEYGSIAAPGTGPAPPGWAGTMSTTLLHAGLVIGMVEHDIPLAISSNLNGPEPTAGELFGGAPTFLDTARARMLRLVSTLAGSRPIASTIENNPTADGDFRALRVLGTRGADGTLRLLVLNLDRDTPVSVQIALLPATGSGDVKVQTLNGDSLASFNNDAHPNAVVVTTTTEPRTDSGLSHSFPPHSVSLIEVPR